MSNDQRKSSRLQDNIIIRWNASAEDTSWALLPVYSRFLDGASPKSQLGRGRRNTSFFRCNFITPKQRLCFEAEQDSREELGKRRGEEKCIKSKNGEEK